MTNRGVTSTGANYAAIEYLTLNMREIDREEIYGISWVQNPIGVAALHYEAMQRGYGSIIWAGGRPVALIGVSPAHGTGSSCWQIFSYGTDRLPRVGIELMRQGRRHIARALQETEVRRIQAESHERHVEAHGWMERMGARREAVMPYYGRDGSTYYKYVWLRNDRHRRKYSDFEQKHGGAACASEDHHQRLHRHQNPRPA